MNININQIIGLLIGIVFAVAVTPFLIAEFGNLEESISGSCVAVHDGDPASSIVDPHPTNGASWALGQSWQVGGPFSATSIPADTDPQTCVDSIAVAGIMARGASTDTITYYYVPTAASDNAFARIILLLIDFMPLFLIVGIMSSVAAVVWMKFGRGGGAGGGGGNLPSPM